MDKKSYKQLQKNLKHINADLLTRRDYEIWGAVGRWVTHCGIKAKDSHTNIICKIFGSVPYPYQKKDRKIILKYLKKNKYKDFVKHSVKQKV